MSDKNTLGLSRRRVLGGLGAIGVASAGAGLGTSAYFSDSESFVNNILEAGELNLIVDWATEAHQGSYGYSFAEGEVDGGGDGETDYSYEISDVKPGDSGTIVLCPKVVDNPAWLWVGSADGATDYENGLTEPESDVDGSGGDPGAGNGELSENIQVTVSYASGYSTEDEDEDGEPDNIVCEDKEELDNPDDYTLADLMSELEMGWLIDADRSTPEIDPYPASEDAETQEGPCLCIEWEVPTDVGNVIQTDSVEFAFSFEAMQQRHNPDPSNPFNDTTTNSS
ncbi:SipW-dependent-type signal peptide-containing protein [Haloarchaeobius iranensis]|uniref:SipW-cognate class signal peptide n=1 Tax=Haloarchaeobius iranensis TaxID=996166 RepID=A0A1G9YFV8_9EURY|nr:SipW-dependent-type signal peptide-containing protein [Haloarchaeobius iranensis]SDN08039.1 SipW-cognate class signal peptide [Haloarchaeobius iranensis]